MALVYVYSRLGQTFCVFAWILVSRYLELVDKSEFPSEVVGEAMQSVVVLTGAMQRRVKELVTLWRRRGLDVDAQIQSYANGLFEGHYRKYRQQEFDADLGRSAEYEYGWNVEGGGVVDGFWADGATSEYDSGHYSPDNGVSRYAVGKSATYGYDEQETYLLEEDEDASDELGDSDGYQDPYTREDEDPGSGPDREDDEDQEPYIQEDDDLGSGEDGENDDLSQDQDIDSEPVGDSYDDQETYLREDDNSSIGVNEDDDGVLEAQLQEDEDVEAPLEGDDDGDQELYLQEEQDAGRGPERDDEKDDEAYLQTDEDIGAELAGNDGDSEADNDEEDQDDGADNDEYAGDQLGDDDDDQGPDLLDQDAQPGENDGDGQVPYFGNAFGEPGGYEDGTQGSYFATDDGNEDCGQGYDDDDQGPGFYPQGDDEGAYDGQGPDDYPQEYDYGGNVGDHW
ncbi:hypothetical protein F5148DRAFT_531706 [Russula earlei]|uniref:Uncharacterized protein n=1 Tax=Russula earlei TaxID=71964 RepID=A0ACC0TWK4_9AGAM|nr:hypothetical protein F5148DRAFT_531706 [Russula earlei]